MKTLPIDDSHPAARDHLSLIWLQILTPLSLLINIVTVVVCAVFVTPSIGDISRQFPTPISPKPIIIAIYVAAIYVGQLGYCIFIVLARKVETKRTVTKGVGLSLVIANWVMALWAITWVSQWFLLSTILQGILLLLLIYANLVLLVYHPPTFTRPLDIMLIHAPFRFFLVLQLGLMFPLSLFINLTYTGGPGRDSAGHPWSRLGQASGATIVYSTNLLGFILVTLKRDIVWSVPGTWICISIWALRPKTDFVDAIAILFTVLHPLSLIKAYIHSQFFNRRAIALPPEDDALHGRTGNSRTVAAPQANSTSGSKEDGDAVWA